MPEGPDRIDDSSAAAIAASGLWDLAALTASGDPAGADRYRDAALTILDSLCSDRYLAWSTPGWEGVLKHGVYHFHKRLGVDESVMWGDFFFLEAVDKVLRAAGETRRASRPRSGHRGSRRSAALPPIRRPPCVPSRIRPTGWSSRAPRRCSGRSSSAGWASCSSAPAS